MPGITAIVTVDARLLWVVSVPESPAGVARAASREGLAAFSGEFEAVRSALAGADHAAADPEAWADAVALAVLESLREPPELPFIGEPFGGEDGTD